MPNEALYPTLSSRLFEHAVQAHARGDLQMRDSLCFWVYMLDEPALTRDTVEKYIGGLRRSGNESSDRVADIIRAALTEILA